MADINNGHSRIDVVKDGFNKGVEYLGNGSKAIILGTTLAVTGVHAKDYSCEELSQIDIFTPQGEAEFNALSPRMQNKAFACSQENTTNFEVDTARRRENIDRQNEIQARQNEIQAEYQASIDKQNQIQANNRAETQRMNANADRMNASTNRMFQITAIMEMVSGERTLSNNEMYTALTAIANDANELGLTTTQSNLLQDLALSYTNGGNGPLVITEKEKEVFRLFIQKIKNQNLILSDEEKTRRFNAVLDTILQYL